MYKPSQPNWLIIEKKTSRVISECRTETADRALNAHLSFFPEDKDRVRVIPEPTCEHVNSGDPGEACECN